MSNCCKNQPSRTFFSKGFKAKPYSRNHTKQKVYISVHPCPLPAYPDQAIISFFLNIPRTLHQRASTSKWPRNEAKFLALSRPQPRKTRIKSLVLKMAEKKAEIPRNSSSRPRKGRGKGKNSSPRLVLDLGKILPKVSSSTSSSPDDPSRTSASKGLGIFFLYY